MTPYRSIKNWEFSIQMNFLQMKIYLKEAFHVLTDVHTAITIVILLRNLSMEYRIKNRNR